MVRQPTRDQEHAHGGAGAQGEREQEQSKQLRDEPPSPDHLQRKSYSLCLRLFPKGGLLKFTFGKISQKLPW